MTKTKIHKLYIYTEDKYNYERTSSVSLSEEHFTKNDIKRILAQLINSSIYGDVKFESYNNTVEVPDELEGLDKKLKEAQGENSNHWLERDKLQKQIEQLEAENKTLKSLCPQSHLPEDENPEDAPNQGTTDIF